MIGPLTTSPNGFSYVLIMCNLHDKYCRYIPLQKRDARSIANAIDHEWFLRLGVPKAILCDNASNLINSCSTLLRDVYGVDLIKLPVRHQSANGNSERRVRFFKERLSFYIETHDFDNGPFDWVTCVPQIEAAQNTCFYPHMASSPFEMRFGRPLKDPLENVLEFC